MKQTVVAFYRSSRLLRLVILAALTTNSVNADLRSTFGQLLNPPNPTPPHAVVRIYAKEPGALSTGSGTLVHVDEQFGYVLTNWHVVRDAQHGQVVTQFPNGTESAATILKMDDKWDLALLRIWKPDVEPMQLSRTVPVIGEPLTIMGYGSGKFRAAHGTCKYYASPDRDSPSEMIEVSVGARQGDSGGPILNARGEIAAVLFGSGRGVTTGTHIGRVVDFLNSIDLIGNTGEQPASDRIVERVIDAQRTKPASLTAKPSRVGTDTSAQHYQLPPLEWSTVNDDSEVIAAAAEVATEATLIAQQPNPRVANQFRSRPRLSLTIEPFESDFNAERIPALQVETHQPKAVPSIPSSMHPAGHPTPASFANSVAPANSSFLDSSSGDSGRVPRNPASRTKIDFAVDPLAEQSTTDVRPNLSPQAPAGFSQPQFSPYGGQSRNEGLVSVDRIQRFETVETPGLTLRKLLAITQSILAIVGVVTLLEKFRR